MPGVLTKGPEVETKGGMEEARLFRAGISANIRDVT